MEPEELRKLRTAHGLTPIEFADMLDVSPQQVLAWEAPKGMSHHLQIDPDSRRHILRQLAILRGRQKEHHLAAIAAASPQRFAAQPYVPLLANRAA